MSTSSSENEIRFGRPIGLNGRDDRIPIDDGWLELPWGVKAQVRIALARSAVKPIACTYGDLVDLHVRIADEDGVEYEARNLWAAHDLVDFAVRRALVPATIERRSPAWFEARDPYAYVESLLPEQQAISEWFYCNESPHAKRAIVIRDSHHDYRGASLDLYFRCDHLVARFALTESNSLLFRSKFGDTSAAIDGLGDPADIRLRDSGDYGFVEGRLPEWGPFLFHRGWALQEERETPWRANVPRLATFTPTERIVERQPGVRRVAR